MTNKSYSFGLTGKAMDERAALITASISAAQNIFKMEDVQGYKPSAKSAYTA